MVIKDIKLFSVPIIKHCMYVLTIITSTFFELEFHMTFSKLAILLHMCYYKHCKDVK